MLCAVVGVVVGAKCYVGKTAADAKATDCTSGGTCSKPKFAEYTGYTSAEFKCGSTGCTAADANCEWCNNGDNCNAPKADRHTFKCTKFAYSADKTKILALDAQTTCNAEKNTKKMCNSNGDKADKLYVARNDGCGPCSDADKKADKCVECEGDNCNAEKDTYKCTNFKYDATKKEFMADATKTTCNAEKDAKKMCNSNGKKADKDYVAKNNGCGACSDADKKADKCVECEGDDCNSAAAITAFLLPMIALFYTIF